MQQIPATVVDYHARTVGGAYDDSNLLFEELRKFFVVARLTHSKCTPSRTVDEAWHFFLEHSDAYHDYFEEQGVTPFGHLVRESPNIEAYQNTLCLLNRTFGNVSEKYWPRNIVPADCSNCQSDLDV
jgi:hypothetical protein